MFHPLEQREGKGKRSVEYTVHSYLLLVHFCCLLNLSRLIRSASPPLHCAMNRVRGSLTLDNRFGGDILSGTPPFSHTKCDSTMMEKFHLTRDFLATSEAIHRMAGRARALDRFGCLLLYHTLPGPSQPYHAIGRNIAFRRPLLLPCQSVLYREI